MLGKELAIPAGAAGDAQDGDLVAVETGRAPRLGMPTGRIVERLGSLASEKAVSLIAIHAHTIPHVFRRDTEIEAVAAKPATLAGREDWRHMPLVTIDPPDAKDHDDAVHAEKDTAANNHGGFNHYRRHRRRVALRHAGLGASTAKRWCRQFGLLP